MIIKTIVDSRYFMLMFVVCVMAFGNAIMIIDMHESTMPDSYKPVYSSAFGSPILDSFIN